MRVAIVLVQAIRDMGQVPLFESLTPFVHEFYLWGIGVCWVRHLGRRGRRCGLSEHPNAGQTLSAPAGARAMAIYMPTGTLPAAIRTRTRSTISRCSI